MKEPRLLLLSHVCLPLSTVSSLKEEPNSGCLYILSPLLNVKENHIGAYLKSSVEKEA